MRYRDLFFLFCLVFGLMLWSVSSLAAQKLVEQQAGPGLQVEPLPLSSSQASFSYSLLYTKAATPDLEPVSVLQMVPAPKAYSYEKLSLFCKWEVRMEKKARFPVKVRLGDVQTVDRLEGKN